MSLVVSCASYHARRPSRHWHIDIIIVKGILKSQHLIVTNVRRLIKLVSLILALLKLVGIILPSTLKSRRVCEVRSNQQLCHLELFVLIMKLLVLSVDPGLILLLQLVLTFQLAGAVLVFILARHVLVRAPRFVLEQLGQIQDAATDSAEVVGFGFYYF